MGFPVEWNKFDLFGDGVVYDEAFFLGNTTFELVTLFAGDSTMKEKARYQRIIFGSEDIDALSASIQKDFQHETPFNFNIESKGEKFAMGKQTTLDSLSKISNFYVTFWQYLDKGFAFRDRTIQATSKKELYEKLNEKLKTNPVGILELKEVHISMSKALLDQWHQLMGPSVSNHWNLNNGPKISYHIDSDNPGIDWITIKVRDLSQAKTYLKSKTILSEIDGKIAIDRTMDFGLQIFLEE